MRTLETMEQNKPRRSRSFTPELQVEMVVHCQWGDHTVSQVTKDFN